MDLKDTLNEALKGKFRRFNKSDIQTREEGSYFPSNKDELIDITRPLIAEDPYCDLNDIWVGDIEDMSYLFSGSNFKGDISRWDVGNVKNMYSMFYLCDFNGDISSWNVSKVENMKWMFKYSSFNGDISKWDVSNVRYMFGIFADCPLEKNPPKWYRD